MLEPSYEGGLPAVRTEHYQLRAVAGRPYLHLLDKQGARLAELFVLSSVHAVGGRDDTTEVGDWQVEQTDSRVTLSLEARSSVWQRKVYRWHCKPERILYEIEVEGAGALDEVDYFGGYSSAHLNAGSGFFWSGSRFGQVFNPEPNVDELHYFSPQRSSSLNLTGLSRPGRGDWFFTPPPFCFAFQIPSGWLGLAVEAAPGENKFTELRYQAQSGFYLALSYEGYTRVNGHYTLPDLAFYFARDEFDALGRHVAALIQHGLAPAPRGAGKPRWWSEPIFCGWGAQFNLSLRQQRAAPDFAQQALYQEFLQTLEMHGVEPGIVVIDDKWQATYGENQVDTHKWPDLSGFIRQQHDKGRHVLLWLKAWDPEGLPRDECITNAAGMPVALDPTHPAYEARARAAVRRMLGPEGYNADGFKVDFTARIPSGPGMQVHGDAWGLELMKRHLALIYDEAKRTKPDALVITHTPHPYLADTLDMIRLNDMLELNKLDEEIGKDVARVMTLRAKVARLACPGALIDTDCWPIRNKALWREYVALQPQLGVPSLYFATHIDLSGEALDAEDYALLRETWAAYRARLGSTPQDAK